MSVRFGQARDALLYQSALVLGTAASGENVSTRLELDGAAKRPGADIRIIC
jgi:hypothetical protein